MKIIVGLGNPGEKYKGTRHNVGFIVTNELAQKYDIVGKTESKFNAIVGKGHVHSTDIIIVQPLTYMNLSGESVIKILNWYKLSASDLIVVYDDISLDVGRIRFKDNGSDAGHNGIKSIIQSLGGNKNFPRLKVGIGPDPGGEVRASYVLGKFSEQEKEILNKVTNICVEGIETFLKDGVQKACNDFNGMIAQNV